jgi:hypothetical protein
LSLGLAYRICTSGGKQRGIPSNPLFQKIEETEPMIGPSISVVRSDTDPVAAEMMRLFVKMSADLQVMCRHFCSH